MPMVRVPPRQVSVASHPLPTPLGLDIPKPMGPLTESELLGPSILSPDQSRPGLRIGLEVKI
jgi:hypothetical protein